jgi:hypothetical protein
MSPPISWLTSIAGRVAKVANPSVNRTPGNRRVAWLAGATRPTCVPCMARIQPGESPGARLVEPKASQRASASSRGGVQRKPKAKSQGDEQKPDMRRDAFGTSGHVTAKSSIYSVGGDTDKGAFCKSGVYARKDSCLTTGDLPCVVAAQAAND